MKNRSIGVTVGPIGEDAAPGVPPGGAPSAVPIDPTEQVAAPASPAPPSRTVATIVPPTIRTPVVLGSVPLTIWLPLTVYVAYVPDGTAEPRISAFANALASIRAMPPKLLWQIARISGFS